MGCAETPQDLGGNGGSCSGYLLGVGFCEQLGPMALPGSPFHRSLPPRASSHPTTLLEATVYSNPPLCNKIMRKFLIRPWKCRGAPVGLADTLLLGRGAKNAGLAGVSAPTHSP